MAIERLWDGQQGREPMHDLMGDIMEYCRKPELRLDCPREDVFAEKPARADFMFIDCGSVGRLAGVIVIGDLLYAAMVFIKKGSEVRLAYEFHEPGDDPSFSFIRFSPVPDRPRAVDFIYKSDSTWHSVQIDVVRESGPTLFSSRRDGMVESWRIRGSLIRNTPGLGFLLIEEGDFYVLRHGRGLKKAATIAKCGTTLPSSVVFGDWSFRYTLKLITEDLVVVKYHPYLL
ncbi:hypothetical protein FOZ60_000371 [Perkinsus olseni]|uniref:Uncharacterized protein n=1 Tax=Perkinsus olseni TaxID=32597 RepID=A0A7J6P2A5_PEROL|nr:hypothetical protein FOZ60_000371 [Perkinsus olseni]